MILPLAMLSQYIFGPALFVLSLFIILIILLQRGRGGGLTGALGGAGGASAFGVKAGDIFTRITAVSVLLWIVLCATMCYWYLPPSLDIASDQSSMSAGPTGAGAGATGTGPGVDESPLPSGDSIAPPPPAGNSTVDLPASTSTGTEQPKTPADTIKLDLPAPVNEPAISTEKPVVESNQP